jgi:hypothetical protein
MQKLPIGSHLYRQPPYKLVTTAPSADLHLINSRCVSKDTCPKTVSTNTFILFNAFYLQPKMEILGCDRNELKVCMHDTMQIN